MLEVQEALTGILALLALHFLLIWYYARGLVGIIEELAFPSDDPIMTSSLKEPVFEYEEEEPEEGGPEAVELTPEEEEVIEEVMAGEEPEETEVFDYDEAPEEPELRQSKIPFLQPDFPWVTLSQLKRLPKADLIDLCEKYEKETDGTKADLVKRLID